MQCYYKPININFEQLWTLRLHGQQIHKQCAFHLDKIKEYFVYYIYLIHKNAKIQNKNKKTFICSVQIKQDVIMILFCTATFWKAMHLIYCRFCSKEKHLSFNWMFFFFCKLPSTWNSSSWIQPFPFSCYLYVFLSLLH